MWKQRGHIVIVISALHNFVTYFIFRDYTLTAQGHTQGSFTLSKGTKGLQNLPTRCQFGIVVMGASTNLLYIGPVISLLGWVTAFEQANKPTQPPTSAGWEMSTSQSAVMLLSNFYGNCISLFYIFARYGEINLTTEIHLVYRLMYHKLHSR